MIKAVIFDFDGVIVDSLDPVMNACNESFRRLGYPIRSRAEYFDSFSLDMTQRFSAWAKEEDVPRLLAVFKQIWFDEEYYKNVRLFAGAMEAIKELSPRYKLAIVSNGPAKSVENILLYLGLNRCFSHVIGKGIMENSKPHPEGVLIALDLLKVKSENAIMIGDCDCDIIAAKEAGLKTIACLYGFMDLDPLLETNPDYTIDSITSLPSIITSLTSEDFAE